MSDLLARAWVALYTRGLPADCRDARRAEITSDLWEQRHDGARTGSGSGLSGALGRVLAGMPADISWRIEERGVVRAGATLGSRQLLRRQVIIIPGISVLVGLVTLAGQPGTAAALLAGLMALALVGLTRGLILSPVAASSGKEIPMETGITINLRRRTTLLIVLGVSMIVLAATYAYALSLEHWGDTREWIFLGLGWGSLIVGVGALSLLIVDIARARRR
ncbi:MAG: hypothetical protein M3457_03495 [Chloroflexota bacterium]|nr:hypothetical protein [Chloroflexota bacterium]